MQSICLLGKHSVEHPDSYDMPEVWSPDHKRDFSMPIYGGVFNIVEWIFGCGSVNVHRVENGMDLPSGFQTVEFFKGLFVPVIPLHQVLMAACPKNSKLNLFTVIVCGGFYCSWVALFCACGAVAGLIPMAWAIFFCAGTLLTATRGGFRGRCAIRSNVVGDWPSSAFFWPQVFVQMRLACVELDLPDETKVED